MLTPEAISTEISPYIAMLITLVASLWAKDLAASFMAGLAFKYNPAFNEGDHVMVDDEHAIIVKIGFRHTVFSITKTDGTQIWRYVRNTKIPFLKLEKVVYDPTRTKKTLDTAIEP